MKNKKIKLLSACLGIGLAFITPCFVNANPTNTSISTTNSTSVNSSTYTGRPFYDPNKDYSKKQNNQNSSLNDFTEKVFPESSLSMTMDGNVLRIKPVGTLVSPETYNTIVIPANVTQIAQIIKQNGASGS